MLALEEALARLLAGVHPTDAETVGLVEAAGRVLVSPTVISAVDVPAFANSAMDGYALRAADLPGTLRIAGEVAAGARELATVAAGEAVRIMTGAPMPPGADAVVPVEDASEADGSVTVTRAVEPGAHVRAAAHDTRRGDAIGLPGALTPAGVAVLASLGIGEVEVRRRPRAAVLSTGDELVPPGGPLRPGEIHDANGVALAAAVTEAGGEPVLLPPQRDDPSSIDRALDDAAARADLVVTSGGVSVGRHDEVRAALERRGSLDFWRVAVQPGKPLAVGSIEGRRVLGLPGNPVSALVTFELFVRPLIRAMLGLAGDGRLRMPARVEERIGKDRDRRAFLRVVVGWEGGVLLARSAGGQLSSQLRPLADANALLVVPEGVEAAEPGVEHEAIIIGPMVENADR